MSLYTRIVVLCIIFFMELGTLFATSKKTNQTYEDTTTKIIWSDEQEARNWTEANAFCKSVEINGIKDWKLPTVRELQGSVCLVTGYPTRNPCPQPRDHKKDSWILNENKKENTNYWASDVIPGDPYNVYYFALNKQGQHIITSKNDKAKFRCIKNNDTQNKKQDNEQTTDTEKKNVQSTQDESFKYFITPLIGAGAYISNEYALERHPYASIDLRIGFNTKIKSEKELYMVFAGDIGANLRGVSSPLLSTITLGLEYFFHKKISCLFSAGVGIIYDELRVPVQYSVSIAKDIYYGLAWKTSLNIYLFKFGEKNNFAIPFTGTYKGVYTHSISSHVVGAYIGLAYFI